MTRNNFFLKWSKNTGYFKPLCVIFVVLATSYLLTVDVAYSATVAQTPTFSASGDAWSGGTVSNRSFSRNFSINLSDSESIGPGVGCETILGVTTCWGAEATLSTSGSIGVSLNASFTDPNYSVVNPYAVTFNVPESTTLAGDGFALGMTALASDTMLTTNFLTPSANTTFFMTNLGASVSGEICFAGCADGSKTLLGTYNETVTLVGFNNPGGGTTPSLTVLGSTTPLAFPYNLKVADTVTITIGNANISKTSEGDGSATVSTLQDVIKIKPDINKMLARATGIPLNLEVTFLGETLGYKTLWGEITPSVGVDMDSTFTAGALSTVLNFDKVIGHWSDAGHTGYTLVNSISLSSGTSLSNYFFLHPGETVAVTPTYSVSDGRFIHTTAATLHAPYVVKLLEGNLAGLGDFGPVYSTSGDLTLASISIASSNFDIPFTAKTGSTFQLTADPGTCQPAGERTSGFIFDPLCTGQLIKTTTGIVELFADNTYSGGTVLQGGILKIEKDANLGATSGTITFDGGTMFTRNFDGSTTGVTSARNVILNTGGGTFDTNGLNSNLSGIISGGGSFTKKGSGILTLSGGNIYDGSTNITGGTLALSGIGSLSNVTALSVSNGSVFSISSANGDRAVGSLSGSGNIVLGGRNLTIGGNDLDRAFLGVISGTGGLFKTGAGKQTLSGSNLYSGGTFLNEGTISVGADSNLGNVSGTLNFNGGTLQVTGTSFNSTARTINWDSNGGGFDISDVNNKFTVNQLLNGNGGLTKYGDGTLSLAGANSYSGGTTITAGALQSGADEVLSDIGVVNIGPNGIFDLNDHSERIGSLEGAGGVDLGAGALTTGGNDADTTFAGVISGMGSVTKEGAGTMVLSGDNIYIGATTVSGGVLQLGDDERLANAATLTVGGGTFNLNGFDETVGDVVLVDGTLDDTVDGGLLTAATYDLQNGTVNAALGTGVLSKTNTGTAVLYGTSQSATVDVNGGVLQLGDDERLANAVALTVGGGTFDLNDHAERIGSLEGDGSVDLGAGALATGGNDSDTTFSGVISGIGSMTKEGAGTMMLSGNNLYSGGTTITAGMLQSGADEVFNDAGAVKIGLNGTFDLNDHAERIGSLEGDGSVDLGAGALTTGGNDSDTTFAGVISGMGRVTKEGAGILDLTGSNTYTGITTINNGILKVNGVLAGDLQNNIDGTLMGGGSIAGLVANSGRLAPGNSIGTLTVGSYVSDPGSIYEVEVDPAGYSDLIAASGTATLNGGTVEVLAAGASPDYRRRTFYTIVEADGGVTGTYAGVTSSLAGLTPMLRYDDPALVQLILMRNDVDFGVIAGARTANQKAVATVMNAASPLAFLGDMPDVLDIFVDDLTETERREALDEMGGQKIHTAMPMVAFGLIEGFQGSVGSRMSRLHQANQGLMAKTDTVGGVKLAMAGDVTDLGPLDKQGQKDRNLWVHAYGIGGDVDGDKNAVGYDYNVYGLAMGIDFPVIKGLNLGLTAGYGNADVKTDLNDDGDVKGILTGLYANYENGGFYLDGMATYADNAYETSRNINFGTLNRTAKADYDGNEWAFAAETGYVAALGNFSIQPFFGTRFIRLDEDDFTEKGADDLNLKVEHRTAYSWKLYPGIKLSHAIKTSGKSFFVPEVSVKWVHELRDDNDTISASFVGAPAAGNFRVDGVEVNDDSVEVGAGFKVLDGSTFQVGVNFNTEFNSDRSSHQAEVGMKYMW